MVALTPQYVNAVIYLAGCRLLECWSSYPTARYLSNCQVITITSELMKLFKCTTQFFFFIIRQPFVAYNLGSKGDLLKMRPCWYTIRTCPCKCLPSAVLLPVVLFSITVATYHSNFKVTKASSSLQLVSFSIVLIFTLVTAAHILTLYKILQSNPWFFQYRNTQNQQRLIIFMTQKNSDFQSCCFKFLDL